MSDGEGPLVRLARHGVAGLSAPDLLAIALARQATDVPELESAAQKLVSERRVHGLSSLSVAELQETAGLDQDEANRVIAAIELGRRTVEAGKGQADVIAGPEDVYSLFSYLSNETQEWFCAAFLDSKGAVIARRTIHIGTLNASIVGPREVFREAVRQGAASLVVVHNHPSGDPTPSPEDIEVTKQLASVGEILDIPLHDHVIIGRRGLYVSLRSRGSF